jgi:hypothetical protein
MKFKTSPLSETSINRTEKTPFKVKSEKALREEALKKAEKTEEKPEPKITENAAPSKPLPATKAPTKAAAIEALEEDEGEMPGSLVDAIMAKRRLAKLADSPDAEELNEEAAADEPKEDTLEEQNEEAATEEDEAQDLVSMIRRKMKAAKK